HIIAASNAIKLGETGHINFRCMVYYHKLSLAKAMDSIKAVFGCWHWSMELGIGIWCHQCRRLDVERIQNWNCEQIPCGIRVYCAYIPPIQRLDPRYHEGFGP